MDAPQLPGAEPSADPTGAQPPGQASAFRRTLDAQLESVDPLLALVPSGPHDLTAPIDVSSLRAAVPTAPAEPPSASGPTVVMPSVSVPALHAPTTITAANHSAGGTDNGGDGGGEPPEHSPRHGVKASRLPTTVGVSALLAAFAGAALVLVNNGHSTAPLAPTALPTRSVTHSPAVLAPPSAAASRKASVSAPPSRTAISPGRSATASPRPSPGRSAVVSSPAVPAGLTTPVTWTNDSEPVIVEIQSRLAKLSYLVLGRGGSQYSDTSRTLNYLGGWTPNPDGVGYYQNTTDSAIRAFEFEYVQHRHGQWPGGGCSSQTYQALVHATS